MMNHYDEMACLLHAEGELEAPRAAELEAHAKECAACGAMLRALRAESLLFSASLQETEEELPARLRLGAAPQESCVARWAWSLGFGLVAIATYVVWAEIFTPWQQTASQWGADAGNLLTMLFFTVALWRGWSSMIDAMQIAALATLGMGVLALLRGRLRRGAAFAGALGVLAMAMAMTPPASAAEVHHGGTYVLPKGEEIHDDLIVTGQSVRIDGTVYGDVIGMGEIITVNGRVTGDVIAFAQSLRVRGAVDGNIRGFVNTLRLSGTVGKNVSAFVQTLELGSNGAIGGSLMSVAQECLLDGKIGGGMLGFNQRTDMEGKLGGTVQLRGRRLSIASTAEVDGPIHFTGEEAPRVEQGARLASAVEFEHRNPHWRRRASIGRMIVHAVLRYGAALLAGLLLLSVLPGLYVDGVRAARRFGAAMGVGAIALLAGGVLLIGGIVLLIAGIGAGVAMALAFAPMMYLAQIFVGAWLGDAILGEKAGTGAQFGRLALGILIVQIAMLVPVPVLGSLAALIVALWGVGAFLLAVYQRSRLAGGVPVAA